MFIAPLLMTRKWKTTRCTPEDVCDRYIDEDVDSIDMTMDIDIGWRYLSIYR